MEATVSSLVFFPELLRRETLVKILKNKFQKINANPVKIDRFNDDELIQFSRRFLVPKPQRQYRNISSNVNDKCTDGTTETNMNIANCTEQCSNNTAEEAVPVVNGSKAAKRKNGTELNSVCKKRLRHSPIRFP